jgi:hypothetical protein
MSNFFSWPKLITMTKSRRIGLTGNIAHKGKKMNSYRALKGNSDGKRPVGIPRCTSKDNIKIDVRE